MPGVFNYVQTLNHLMWPGSQLCMMADNASFCYAAAWPKQWDISNHDTAMHCDEFMVMKCMSYTKKANVTLKLA